MNSEKLAEILASHAPRAPRGLGERANLEGAIFG